MGFFQNTCKPKGIGGSLMVSLMNRGHAAVSRWGLEQITFTETDNVLDIGCGGGANVGRMLRLCPRGFVTGIDYSAVSVDAARDHNRREIAQGRCLVLQADISHFVYPDNVFNVVTAFETVYFWPDPMRCFRSIHRFLKPGGTFLICNESDGEQEKDEKWLRKIQGMTIYTDDQLRGFLRGAGFRDIIIRKKGNGWLAVIARK